jgi:alpha-L-fucosidase
MMRKIFICICLVASLISRNVFAQSIAPSVKPNMTQKLLIDRGYGMFIHFGVNTFTDVEWSDGTIPAEKYNPTKLDCDQWVKVARDAGFRYVLLVTKHHDGFCLWDSKFTDYDVASSPVKIDVVGEVAKACKKYGLKFAIYYSLWDRHDPSYKEKDPQKYIDYMKNQLTELLTNYGEVCELWFDGGWDRKLEDWKIDQVYATVKKMQPNCAVGINHTIVNEEGSKTKTLPGLMTEDNKYFFRYFPGDFRLWDPKIANRFDKKQYLHNGQSYYLPFEHTICLSKRWNWFQKSENLPVRDLDELEELFYWCTYNDNSLLIDVPPDNTGRIREYEANTVITLGNRIGIKKDKPLPQNGKLISILKPASASSVLKDNTSEYKATNATDGNMESRWASVDTLAELTIQLNPSDKFNKISIFEYCDIKQEGEFINYRYNRIKEYTIDIWQNNEWTTIYYSDESMGDCKVLKFPKYYQTNKIRLKVLKATAPPSIYEFHVILK